MDLRSFLRLGLSLLLCYTYCVALGQWRVHILHPGSATESAAWGVNAGETVGYVRVNGVDRAVVWRGLTSEPDYLASEGSYATKLRGSTAIGGGVYVNGEPHAALWPTSKSTWIDLAPPGAGFTLVAGVGGLLQAGRYGTQAAVWQGSPASMVVLAPKGSTGSEALAPDGVYQVGSARFGGPADRAYLWQGSAESGIDLTSPNALSAVAADVGGGIQVGWQNFQTGKHAGMWRGSASSFVSLRPYPLGLSAANAIDSNVQVGYWTDRDGTRRACLWRGISTSWEDLYAYLPEGTSISEAFDICVSGSTIRICGTAQINGVDKAVLWVSDNVIEVSPATFSVVQGAVFQGNTASLAASDDEWLIVGSVQTAVGSAVTLQFEQVAPQSDYSYMGIAVDGHANESFNNIGNIYAFNFSKKTWDLIKSHPTGVFYDTPIHCEINNPSSYIEPVTRRMMARVKYELTSTSTSWQGWFDRATWSFPSK
ncbi:MAG: hypothetical protein M3R13_05350 [Armatimonadota bacterium]|nr:hypothetical protein [Armatimonadota bacterium]